MILYKKFQSGGTTDDINYFWDPAHADARRIFPDVASAEAFFKDRYKTKTQNGTWRCTGSALDACGYDWRANLNTNNLPNIPGDDRKSLDAWDLPFAIKASPKSGAVIYDKAAGNHIEAAQLKTLPVGTLIGMHDARGSRYGIGRYPVALSRHTEAVIGYLEDGTPLLYSLGKIRPVNQLDMNEVNYIAVPNAKKDYSYIKEAFNNYNKVQNSIPIDQYIKSLPETTQNFKHEIKNFAAAIDSNRAQLMAKLNLSPRGFEELRKQAIALATQESGKSTYVGLAADAIVGSTKGLTQLNGDYINYLNKNYNLQDISQANVQRKYGASAKHLPADLMDSKTSALYTMAMLADNAHRYKRSKTKYTAPSTIKEFRKEEYQGIKDILSRTAPVIASILPSANTAAKIAAKLPSWSKPSIIYRTRKTKGTNPNLSDIEVAAYLWNNPRRIVRGDAQGAQENNYVRNVQNYYNVLTGGNKTQ